MNVLNLLEIKFKLECISMNKDTLELYRTDGSTCDDIEKAFFAKCSDGKLYSLYEDRYIQGHSPSEVFESDELAEKLFAGCVELRRELWYFFERTPPYLSNLVIGIGDTPDTLDTFIIPDDDGGWKARAWSVRRNEESAEIAVETKEEHRRKGFGTQVVSAWVTSQIERGKIGIYAHRKYNLESKHLAEKVGATLFADILSIQ